MSIVIIFHFIFYLFNAQDICERLQLRLILSKFCVHFIFSQDTKIKSHLLTSDEILIMSLFRMIYENTFINAKTNLWVNHF